MDFSYIISVSSIIHNYVNINSINNELELKVEFICA